MKVLRNSKGNRKLLISSSHHCVQLAGVACFVPLIIFSTVKQLGNAQSLDPRCSSTIQPPHKGERAGLVDCAIHYWWREFDYFHMTVVSIDPPHCDRRIKQTHTPASAPSSTKLPLHFLTASLHEWRTMEGTPCQAAKVALGPKRLTRRAHRRALGNKR